VSRPAGGQANTPSSISQAPGDAAATVTARLIVNPTSGAESASARLPELNQRLRQALGHLDIVMTASEGDAERAGRESGERGYTHVLVGGGDGTLNEVLNGLGTVPGALESTTLGVLPLGTGNDFAHALGVSADPEEAAEQFLRGRARRVDLARVGDRVFVNASAGGFIAETSDHVDARLKTLAGRFAYLIGGAQALVEYEPVEAVATVDGHPLFEGPLQMFAVSNGPTIGGGHRIAPDARLDDGLLELCLIHAMPLVPFLALLARVSAGAHVGDDHVVTARGQRIELTFGRSLKINTDGEVLEAARCRYGVEHARLTFRA
jgi:diacylglycerol kinase (ATP)